MELLPIAGIPAEHVGLVRRGGLGENDMTVTPVGGQRDFVLGGLAGQHPSQNHQSRQAHTHPEKSCGRTVHCPDSIGRARCKNLRAVLTNILSSKIVPGVAELQFGWTICFCSLDRLPKARMLEAPMESGPHASIGWLDWRRFYSLYVVQSKQVFPPNLPSRRGERNCGRTECSWAGPTDADLRLKDWRSFAISSAARTIETLEPEPMIASSK